MAPALHGGGTTAAIETITDEFGGTADLVWNFRGDTEGVGCRSNELIESAHLLTNSERKVIRDMIKMPSMPPGPGHRPAASPR